MKCPYCSQRKAKRTCPALDSICSRCCGKHRRREIECPSTCVHLPQPEDVAAALRTALEKLAAFVTAELMDWSGPAIQAFTGPDGKMDEWEIPPFIGYLHLGYTDTDGKRAIDLFFEQARSRLKDAEHEALTTLQREGFLSHFRVLGVRLDLGVEVEDLLNEDRFFIHERMATHQLRAGDELFAWVVPFGERCVFTGSMCTIPPGHVELVNRTLGKVFEFASPMEDEHRIFARAFPAVHAALRDAIRNWTPPRLVVESW